jgi:hypothetical protein
MGTFQSTICKVPYPATKKDGLENSLRTKVCAGLMTLVAAQTAIANNWESAA